MLYVYILNCLVLPFTIGELQNFDAVILSDIGSNTLLLNDDVFVKGQAVPDRLELIRDYVELGGGFCMVGGYMSFTGIEAKARYNQTAIADILPVKLLDIDDRCETCNGVIPIVVNKSSPILKNIEGSWPLLLGYNKTIGRENAEIPVTVNGSFNSTGRVWQGQNSSIYFRLCSSLGVQRNLSTGAFIRHFGRILLSISVKAVKDEKYIERINKVINAVQDRFPVGKRSCFIYIFPK